MKGGQGLPLETIIIAAVAILVLVIVLLFATGAWSRLMGGEKILESEATPEQVSGFKLGCENACFQAKQLADNPTEWSNSDYCSTKKLRINDTTTYNCWDDRINVICGKDIPNPGGTIWHCTATVADGCVC